MILIFRKKIGKRAPNFNTNIKIVNYRIIYYPILEKIMSEI